MEFYAFYDTDYSGNEEYDIEGEEYQELISFCFKASKYFSLYHKDKNIELYNMLKPYRIKSTEIKKKDCYGNITVDEISYYSVCDETFKIFTTQVKSIFSWIQGWGFNNPEDPKFYRDDGSILLDSSIHNGEVRIFPINEDISNIIKNPLWKKETK